jgi:hypothetical protein
VRTYTRDAHLAEHIATGALVVADVSIARGFGDYLDQLPWLGTRLDWGRMSPARRINLAGLTAEELLEWFRSTALGASDHVAVFYARSQPGAVCSLAFAAEHFDLLFWTAPGRRFLFSVSSMEGGWHPNYSALAEYDGSERVTAVVRDAPSSRPPRI